MVIKWLFVFSEILVFYIYIYMYMIHDYKNSSHINLSWLYLKHIKLLAIESSRLNETKMKWKKKTIKKLQW